MEKEIIRKEIKDDVEKVILKEGRTLILVNYTDKRNILKCWRYYNRYAKFWINEEDRHTNDICEMRYCPIRLIYDDFPLYNKIKFKSILNN